MEEENNVIYSYVEDGEQVLVTENDTPENLQIIEAGGENQILTTDENGQLVICAEPQGQEVFVYDNESGGYEKYVFLAENENGQVAVQVDDELKEDTKEEEIVEEDLKEQEQIEQEQFQQEHIQQEHIQQEHIQQEQIQQEEKSSKNVILNQAAIGDLEPGKIT